MHSKRVFSLSRTLGTRVLLSLNRRFLGSGSRMRFLCMKHSKRVFSLSSTRETRVLLSLNRRFLGAQNSNEFRAQYGKPYQIYVPSKRY